MSGRTRGIIENAIELSPLGVFAGTAERPRHRFELAKFGNLRFELGDGLRRGRAVEEPFLVGFQLLAGGLLEVALVESGLDSRGQTSVGRGSTCRPTELLLLQPPFEAGKPPSERFVNGGGRGCEATLRDLEREPDVVPPARAVLADPLGAVHLLADVTGDRFVQLRLPGESS